ncbi:MAG: L-histidine N(alpha)-methyltransferase [Cyclobacteriaceae bacterium]|nr:L-histidine N(alpha)-methyltransferase [Cyclobacteriaceae bacterium]
MTQTSTYNPEILSVIGKGLSGSPKRLPSWLFYDEKGDKIFQAIMQMPEYYLTSSEFEILQTQKHRILRHIVGDNEASNAVFKLVELGAGDGTKTEVLLNHFISQRIDFTYVPVDVSEAVLTQLVSRLNKSLPDLKIHAKCELYSDALESMKNDTSEKKLILFLGANIGNFNKEEAITFVKKLAINMNENDRLLIGFDLKKDPRLILAAYDDVEGITRDFNLNLLGRINREFGGEFDLDLFSHYPYYDPEIGVTKSFLVSEREQEIWIEALDKFIHFDRYEVIHTEVSQKYDLKMINSLASQAGLDIVDVICDKREYFADVIFKVKR